jgi:hypothetical protein
LPIAERPRLTVEPILGRIKLIGESLEALNHGKEAPP